MMKERIKLKDFLDHYRNMPLIEASKNLVNCKRRNKELKREKKKKAK